MHPVFVQMFGYMGVLLMFTLILGVWQKGFFWKYAKVKASFGAKLMVKLREVNRDLFVVGWIEEGFLNFKRGKNKFKIAVPKDRLVFYRCMGVTWIDIDAEKGAVCTADYKGASGFDGVKFENLYIRALYAPKIQDNINRIILILLVIILIAIVIIGIVEYSLGKKLDTTISLLNALKGGISELKPVSI